jgi:hypothetical protein
MEEDNKSSLSKSSLTSRSGIALDKHCFALNIETKVKCTGKKYSGTNYSAHKKSSNHDKETKDFVPCGEDCEQCLKNQGKKLRTLN